MAFQQPGPDGVLPYRTTVQTLRTIAAKEGVMTLWSGFLPYYGRCGGHSVTMFVFVEVLRDMYKARVAEKADPIA
jgi:solute carrier family 25 oxoglutarate transporter 11